MPVSAPKSTWAIDLSPSPSTRDDGAEAERVVGDAVARLERDDGALAGAAHPGTGRQRRDGGTVGAAGPAERRAEALPVEQVAGDLVEEARRRVVLRCTPRGADGRAREVEPLAGPGDADVGEAALLLELLGVAERAHVREDAVLEAGEEDDRELEALGRVQRHQRDDALRLGLAARRGSGRRRRPARPARGTPRARPRARRPRARRRAPARRRTPRARWRGGRRTPARRRRARRGSRPGSRPAGRGSLAARRGSRSPRASSRAGRRRCRRPRTRCGASRAAR